MSTRRPYRITRAVAEQILGGNPVDQQAGPDELVRLLAAAAAPAAPTLGSKVTGEEAAVAAFLNPHLGPAVQPRRDLMIKTALAKVLTVKIAAVALAAATACGVWLATWTPALHGLVGNATHTARGAVSHAPVSPAPMTSAEKTAYRIASLAGTCEAYQTAYRHANSAPSNSKIRSLHAKIAREFAPLIAAAGGTEPKADAYCRGLLRELRHRYPGGLPSHLPSKLPADMPARLSAALPTGLPTGLPTSLPTLPVGLPSHLPTSPPTPAPTILPHGSQLPIPYPGH